MTNGLRYIRNRCNLSMTDLAKHLGLSRQVLSAWETGKKTIPNKRLEELSDFFGIGKEFFGPLTDESKKYLQEKAMFTYIENDKEYYKYKPHKENSLEGERIRFIAEEEMNLSELFTNVNTSKQNILKKADYIIRYYDKEMNLQSKICCLNRGCSIYGSVNEIMEGMEQQSIIMKMPYFYDFLNLLHAFEIAHDLKSKEEILSQYEEYENHNMDSLLEMAEIIKDHWKETEQDINRTYTSFQKEKQDASKKSTTTPNDQASVQKYIQALEEENRKFWKDNPSLREKHGLTVHI